MSSALFIVPPFLLNLPLSPEGEGWGEGIKVNDFEYIAPHF
jgi:hypothetical protein